MTDLYTALQNGLNLEWLLIELQLDANTFRDLMEYDKFTATERKIINSVILRWENGRD